MWLGSEENSEVGHWKRYIYCCGSYSWYSEFRGRPGINKIRNKTRMEVTRIYLWLYSKISKFLPVSWFVCTRLKIPKLNYQPDPKAGVINAFCVSWHDLPFYCTSPFSCIGKVIISDNATGMLIVPNWLSQFWFIILQDLLLTAFIIPRNADNFYLPNQPDLKHPFCRNLEFMACLVSAKALASSSTYSVGL